MQYLQAQPNGRNRCQNCNRTVTDVITIILSNNGGIHAKAEKFGKTNYGIT